MTGSVGEHATDSSQPSRKGAVRGNITALEAAYGEYRYTYIMMWSCRIACSRGRELILDDRPRVRPGGSVEWLYEEVRG